ncbi:carbohydrate ABC transporter permease [Agromyces sp. Soil535]|uniref:carbohydrate ABC transporter permease n=1 Tax=Agromyces sp. Soil535 TaxID=1736390 RepID=UPI000AF95DF3|nr:sugar ABC transporter permease [Agromyces sp. Soil535]
MVLSAPTNQRRRPAVRFGYDNAAGVLFSLPAVLLLIGFVVVPFIMAFVLSMQIVRLDAARPPIWVGLEQYRRILFDPDFSPIFWRSLLNNLTFALIVVPVQTALAVALAVLLNQKLRGIAFFRTFFFLPVVFPMALVAVVWTLIFSRDSLGLLNGFLSWISFGAIPPQDWLGNPALALISIAIMSIWAGVGFQMVIVLAGLQEIPPELYEAASIDKASKWQQFLHVTLPGLRNTLVFVIMITTIFSLRLFDQVYIMTSGGPDDSTTTVMYQAVTSAFVENNVGRGSAMTVIFVLIIIAITLIQRRILRQDTQIS